ncbi:MAG TPA: D-xylose ABC transporter substrate-binding protein [Blastocatellia bacterium]|nr:D-xylose ABC transporter substrate-binding protein [Blastocatellia bacterium]
MRLTGTLMIVLLAGLLAGGCICSSSDAGASAAVVKTGPVRIGFSMDTLKEERWQRDRDYFVARAKELGAEVLVQAANGDDAVQIQQAENLLTQGVDVLVVAPHNAEIAASIVESARRQGVPVLSYDRLIRNSDVNLYVSFDNVKVGETQARYLLERAPKGNYVLIGGSPTDNNARLFRQGQMNVLQPAIDSGAIKVVADQWAREWLASEALKHTENALTQTGNNIAAVVASNDGTAGGAIRALEEQQLAGRVVVSGQDAELAAIQRVVAGTQAMTVYKPVQHLARRAAEAAVALARGEPVESTSTVNNGLKEIPSVLLEPIVVDKNNVVDTIVADGYHKMEDIYRNIPRSQWPKPPAESGK